MREPRTYQNRARRYRVLAKGYSTLNSQLAWHAEGAAQAFEQMERQTDRHSVEDRNLKHGEHKNHQSQP